MPAPSSSGLGPNASDERDPRADLPRPDQDADVRWRGVLLGDASHSPGLARFRRMFRHLPSDPRCKLCYAPYGPPFGPVLGLMGFGRWSKNPSLCGSCLRIMERHQGGAEVELSMLFADVRDSTGLAARTSPAAYSRLLNGFYAIAARAVEERGGSIDKYLGDGVFALFIPGFSGPDHASRAIEAARRILRDSAGFERGQDAPAPLAIGAAVHTGTVYVGVVGKAGDLTDFTALGEAVNITQRINSVASAGELLVSDAAVTASGITLDGLTRRELDLRGVDRPVVAWSQRTVLETTPAGG